MGKYIKYFTTKSLFAQWYNFELPDAPIPTLDRKTFVAYIPGLSGGLRYYSGDNSDVEISASFSTPLYSDEYASLQLKTGEFYAQVWDADELNLIGTYNRGTSNSVSIYIGANDTPFTKQFSVVVKWFASNPSYGAEAIHTDVVEGSQEPNPEGEPLYAKFDVVYTSDGVTPTVLGSNGLNGSVSITYDDNGVAVDMASDVYISSRDLMYQFPSAGTYTVTYTQDCYDSDDNTLYTQVLLRNTVGTSVYIYTNYPNDTDKFNFDLSSLGGNNAAIETVVFGVGLKHIYGSPFGTFSNMTTLRFLDENMLPDITDAYVSMAPSGVTAYANENAENYDAWTAATEEKNWTWINPLAVPLTFEITSPGQIKWGADSGTKEIEYSLNGGAWTSLSGNSYINVVMGDTVQFRGNHPEGYGGRSDSFYQTNCGFNLSGNIMSMLYYDDFANNKSIVEPSAFAYFFTACSGLTSAANLILPATTLSEYCYYNMFYGCQSLTTAPELPAPTLVDRCYFNMFYYCTSLNYIKCLATDISAEGCTNGWVMDVPNSGGGGSSDSSSGSGSDVPFAGGTFVKAAGMNDWQFGINGIPEGWTVVNA